MAGRFDPNVAKKHLAAHIARLRSMSYASLADKVKRRDIETYAVEEPDGASYQLEILFLWDDKPDGDIRVMGFGFMNPSGRSVTDDFIIAADGQFVGE
jgi:hypothetical protein